MSTVVICEGCHGMGGNWTCDGENEDSDYGCSCEYCTGCEACQECGGCGQFPCPNGDDCDCHEQQCGCGGDDE